MSQENSGINNDKRGSIPHWDSLYSKGEDVFSLPWYNENLDDDLLKSLRNNKIVTGKFLDLGTGPATQAIELSRLGFQVTGTDISRYAIDRAKKLSSNVEFIVDDIVDSKIKENSFDYIFDRGCFHVLDPSSREAYVDQVNRILRTRGILFLKTFSSKEPLRTDGPYRFSIDEIRSIFDSRFRIESFKETVYQGTLKILPRALFAVLRKR